MSYATATTSYREMEVLSASPIRLVGIVYDYLLVHLKRASIGIETGNVELRNESLARAQDAVAELMGGLDLERGGEIARQLSALYTFFIASLIDVGRRNDARTLARITAQVADLREAFQAIAPEAAAPASAA